MFKNHKTWSKWYDEIKGGIWPPCPLEVDYEFLPDYVKEKMLSLGYDPQWSRVQRFTTDGKQNLTVFYSSECDGGGTSYSQDYIDNIRARFPNRQFNKCYEWCSGPGFIGFSMLGNDICKSLCLSDIYNPALVWAEETRNYPGNKCQDLVSIYLLKDLALLPDYEKFDLVVSNPPHAKYYSSSILGDNLNRIVTDLNWEAHENFYCNIKKHLTPDGVILLLENNAGSTVNDFLPMIDDNGLKIVDTWRSSKLYTEKFDSEWDTTNTEKEISRNQIYYIEITHK
jgi:hypothetical protein